jgi:hypothetical protein
LAGCLSHKIIQETKFFHAVVSSPLRSFELIYMVLVLFVFAVLGLEPRALHMPGKHTTTELFPQLLVYVFESRL